MVSHRLESIPTSHSSSRSSFIDKKRRMTTRSRRFRSELSVLLSVKSLHIGSSVSVDMQTTDHGSLHCLLLARRESVEPACAARADGITQVRVHTDESLVVAQQLY
jgi:hypothetical protein